MKPTHIHLSIKYIFTLLSMMNIYIYTHTYSIGSSCSDVSRPHERAVWSDIFLREVLSKNLQMIVSFDQIVSYLSISSKFPVHTCFTWTPPDLNMSSCFWLLWLSAVLEEWFRTRILWKLHEKTLFSFYSFERYEAHRTWKQPHWHAWKTRRVTFHHKPKPISL